MLMDKVQARVIFAEANAILKNENCDYIIFTRKDPSGIKETVDITIEKIDAMIGNDKMGYRPCRRITIDIDGDMVFIADKTEGVSFEVIKMSSGNWQKLIHSRSIA